MLTNKSKFLNFNYEVFDNQNAFAYRNFNNLSEKFNDLNVYIKK